MRESRCGRVRISQEPGNCGIGPASERYFIEFLYDGQVTGNVEKAYQTLETWYRMYPRDGDPPTPQGQLAGGLSQFTGRFEKGIELGQKEIAVHPDVSFSYGNLALSYFFRDRFAEADAILQRAAERKMQNPNHLLIRYEIAVLTGDQSHIDRIAPLAKGKQEEHRVTHAEALSLARSGRLAAARLLSNRAVDLAMIAGDGESAASYRAARGVWEALYGNAAEGKSSATAALKLSKGRDLEYASGLGLAFSGDSSQAQALAVDLENASQKILS